MIDRYGGIREEDFREVWPNALAAALECVDDITRAIDVQLDFSKRLVANHAQAHQAFGSVADSQLASLSELAAHITASSQQSHQTLARLGRRVGEEVSRLAESQHDFIDRLLMEKSEIEEKTRRLQKLLEGRRKLPLVKRLWLECVDPL